ncbi:MAG: hypothetical protein QW838_05025 [Candidatus Nitrosotenuis sp.]
MKLLFIALAVFSVTPVFAQQNLEFKSISGSNDQINIDIQFGEIIYKNKPLQTLESVTIGYGVTQFTLLEPQARLFPQSIIISSLHDGIYITAKNRLYDIYDINVFVFTENGIYKQTLSGAVNEPKEASFVRMPQIIETRPVDLQIFVKQDVRTYWAQPYDIHIKAFDASLNKSPFFDSFDGVLAKTNLKVTLTHEKATGPLAVLEGTTNSNGYWHGSYFVRENLTMPGKYFVDIVAKHGNVEQTQRLIMFVIADTGAPDSSTSPSP